MLEMLTPMKAKLVDYKTLSRKNRPADEKPGVKLTVEQQLPNTFLDHFDPKLKAFLYERAAGAKSAQQSLEGVAEVTDAPNLTPVAMKMGKFTWHHDMTGYAVHIIRGTGMAKGSNIALDDAILCNWRLACKEGGTFIGKFDIEAGNVPGDAWETFAELKSREFEITAKAPEVTQQSIDGADDDGPVGDGDGIPPAPRKPGAAERAAVAKVKGDPAPKPAHKPSKAAARAAAEAAFKPEPPKPTVTTRQPAGSRTARGLAKTKAALQAGEAAAGDGAGNATDEFINRHTAADAEA